MDLYQPNKIVEIYEVMRYGTDGLSMVKSHYNDIEAKLYKDIITCDVYVIRIG